MDKVFSTLLWRPQGTGACNETGALTCIRQRRPSISSSPSSRKTVQHSDLHSRDSNSWVKKAHLSDFQGLKALGSINSTRKASRYFSPEFYTDSLCSQNTYHTEQTAAHSLVYVSSQRVSSLEAGLCVAHSCMFTAQNSVWHIVGGC